MRSRFTLWATTLVISLIVSGLCLRLLALRGISLSESLITRGLGCLVFVLIFASRRSHSLRPRSPSSQLLRAVIGGLALTLFTMSYQWLSASAVSVLSNIDVPFLIVLGPLVGVRATGKMRFLALGSITFLIWYVSGLEAQANLTYGLASLVTGTLLLCVGYFFIKKSMNEENEAVTILVPSVAIVVYGLVASGPLSGHWNFALILVALLSGASMFGAYFATMRLYEQTDLASAEFPTLISSIVIQPIEALLLGNPLRATYLLSSIGFVVAIYFLMLMQDREAVHA